MDNPATHPIVAPILRLRQRELLLTNLSVCLLATSTFSTPIRLPNAVNLHFLKLKELEEFARRDDIEALLLRQEKFKEINACLKMEIGDKLSKLITDKASYCTICSDMPLEWVYLDKLPLMISHEVSKIPMTTGNMLLQYCAPGDGINLTALAFEKILVLRSFDADDRLKSILEKSIKGFPISKKTTVQFVDVNTVDEVVEALNSFQGVLVIFDCHGSHDGPEGNGWLKIGNQQLNTWELAHIAQVPPIVLLSACSTSAIGGSHASVANGLLRSGALSVLGTLLPVNGLQSAIFMARLIYRLDSFLPAIKNMGFKKTTFRTIISTFFRMSYLTEILDYFEKEEKILLRDDYVRLHMKGSFMINSLSPNWYDETIGEISKITNESEDKLLSRIHKNKPLMETMLYCQHGRPELITIYL
ncbi:CHAT domain protein [compost metagenome]